MNLENDEDPFAKYITPPKEEKEEDDPFAKYIAKPKEEEPEEETGFLAGVKSFGNTLLKGGIEGVSRLGTALGPLQGPEETRKQLEHQTKFLDENIKSKDEYIQNSIRRALREAPTAIANPIGAVSLPRVMIASFLGEGAKELGAPEWAQAALELTAYIGPDVTRKLLEKGSNKEIIAHARKLGLTDEQITPLLQSDFKTKWLSKLAPKGGSSKEALNETHKGLKTAYGSLQNSKNATIPLSEKATTQFKGTVDKLLKEMPAEVRDKIGKDVADLFGEKITGKSLMNFYADVNHNLSGNTKQLSLLKDPIKKAIESTSPELAKDFTMINDLYSKYYPIASKLKPTIVSQIFSAGEAMAAIGAVITGNVPVLGKIIGERAARKLSEQLLINPRFQQFGQKMVTALNENKGQVVTKLIDEFKSDFGKTSPELAQILDKLTPEQLKEFFSNQEKTEE